MAESVHEFFNKSKTMEIIKKLDDAGVNLKGEKKQRKSNILENMNICITGSFDEYTRDDIVKMIEENSGKATTSVSKKTSILIAGEAAGSKLQKATTLGIRVVTIDEFLDMINEEGNK